MGFSRLFVRKNLVFSYLNKTTQSDKKILKKINFPFKGKLNQEVTVAKHKFFFYIKKYFLLFFLIKWKVSYNSDHFVNTII